ncbi:hypothetical protein D3C81_1990790 [compost metagenome]
MIAEGRRADPSAEELIARCLHLDGIAEHPGERGRLEPVITCNVAGRLGITGEPLQRRMVIADRLRPGAVRVQIKPELSLQNRIRVIQPGIPVRKIA